MSTRRSFLRTSLVGTITAPLIARALVEDKPTDIRDFKVNGLPGPPGRLVKTRPILVPSNRISFSAYRNPDGSIVQGYIYAESPMTEWDGTFKLEHDCRNPAYIFADLITHGAPPEDQHALVDWKALYHWGKHCDELVYGVNAEMFQRRSRNGQGFPSAETKDYMGWMPQFTVPADLLVPRCREGLKQDLSMHLKAWKASDSRYCRSWPVWV